MAGEKEHERGRFSEMFEDLRSGEASLADYWDELEAALPSSLLESMAAVSASIAAFASGEMSLKDAEKVVREQADLHPNHPFFFQMCMDYALRRGNDVETDGYTALTKTKADRREEITGEDFISGLDDVFLERLTDVELADEDPFSVFTYLEGGGDHLINHFLVEEVLAAESELNASVLELVLERKARVMPVILAMLGELLMEMSPSEIPAGFVFLLRIVGHLRTFEALPILLAALDGCISLPLHEAVLALAKLGTAYPDEVSREMRKMAFNPGYDESRLAAVEVLGLLWEVPGNLPFLMEELQRLEPDDEFYRDLFTFLVSAVLSSSREEAFEAVSSALEANAPFLDARTVYLARKYLTKGGPSKASILLEYVREEDVRDLLYLYPPPDIAAQRRTLTLAREEALKEAMLQSLPDLSEVEEKLRTGRDEPCPCGSGKRFRNCCLHDLTEMRELLLLRKKVEGEPHST